MALEGMDVDQAQSLARRLDANAQALAHITAALSALTAELGRSWLGPASAAFQQQWTAQHRAALTSAAQALADMNTHLTANIQQQIRASAADSPSSGGAGAGASGTEGHRSVFNTVDDITKSVLWPLDRIRELSGRHLSGPPTGHGPLKWLQEWGEDKTFPHLRNVPLVHWLSGTREVKDADNFLFHAHVYKALDVLGPAGTVLGLTTAAGDVVKAGADVGDHHYASAGGELVNTASDALMSGKGVFWLAGFDIEMAKKDVELISQPGTPSPFSWANLKNDYWPGLEGVPQEAWQERRELLDLVLGEHG
jgi:uncharacterized protein YukE